MRACAAYLLDVAAARGVLVAAILFGVTIAASVGHIVFAVVPAVAFGFARSADRPRRLAAWTVLAASVILLVASVRVRLAPLSPDPPFLDTRPAPYAVAHSIAFAAFRASPLVGVGLECFRAAWPAYYDPGRFDGAFVGGQESELGVPLDPHSTYLGYIAEAGVFGALVLTALGVLAIRRRGRAHPAYEPLLVFAACAGVFADLLTFRELAFAAGLFAQSIRTETAKT